MENIHKTAVQVVLCKNESNALDFFEKDENFFTPSLYDIWYISNIGSGTVVTKSNIESHNILAMLVLIMQTEMQQR